MGKIKDFAKSKSKERKEDTNIGLKQWIIKIIFIFIILSGFVYFIDIYFDSKIFVDTITAIMIVLAIGFTHEALHYATAVKLGYKPKWYRTRFMMGFEISHNTKREVWLKHKRKIGLAPYIVLVPILIIILIIGIISNNLGFTIAGIAGLLLHVISLPSEGKSI